MAQRARQEAPDARIFEAQWPPCIDLEPGLLVVAERLVIEQTALVPQPGRPDGLVEIAVEGDGAVLDPDQRQLDMRRRDARQHRARLHLQIGDDVVELGHGSSGLWLSRAGLDWGV